MKKILTYLLVGVCTIGMALGASSKVWAQVRSAIDIQQWPEGTVILVSGDTLEGPITFHRTQDIINVHHPDGSINSLTPVNVAYFVVKGMPAGEFYTFRSLPWDMGRNSSNFKKPTFFEQLNSGPITLMMRESYVPRETGNFQESSRNGYYHPEYYYPPNIDWEERVREIYYALLPDGDIVMLRKVKRDLLTLFGKKANEVKAYAKKNRLSYNQPSDVVAIINYFNSLHLATNPSALK